MPVPQHGAPDLPVPSWLSGVAGGRGPGEAPDPSPHPRPPRSPLMLNDGSAAHSGPKYSRQYSLQHVHGPGPYSVSALPRGWPGSGRGARCCGSCHIGRLPPPAGSLPGLRQLQPLLPRCRRRLRTHHLRHHRTGPRQPLGLPGRKRRREVGAAPCTQPWGGGPGAPMEPAADACAPRTQAALRQPPGARQGGAPQPSPEPPGGGGQSRTPVLCRGDTPVPHRPH